MALSGQFEDRTVEKEYFAIVVGVPRRDRDEVELPIGAHPYHREKMAIRRDHPTSPRGDRRSTKWSSGSRDLRPSRSSPRPAGRTRFAFTWRPSAVRSSAIGYTAAGRRSPAAKCAVCRRTARYLLSRQALHARRLRLVHPTTGEPLELIAPLPADIEAASRPCEELLARVSLASTIV